MRRSWWVVFAASLAIASDLEARFLGISFDVTSVSWFWQLLDENLLRTDLLRSVWYLHSQPPLLNLFVGALLKVPSSVRIPAFAAISLALAWGLLLSTGWMMRRLGAPLWMAVGACAMLAFQPSFVIYSHWLFYTFPVAALLTASAAALGRFIDGGGPHWAHAFGLLAAGAMLTRAVFHPLWFVIAVAIVCAMLEVPRRRVLLRAAVVPLVVVNLWCAKNWNLVGVYGGSSWLGMNLRHGWNLSPREMNEVLRSGTVPRVWEAEPFLPARAYRRFGFFASSSGADHPAIDAVDKANGSRNLNHREYARVSRAMLVGDLAAIRAYPSRYLARVRRALWIYLQPGPLIIFAKTDVRPAMGFRDAASWILYLARPVGLDGLDGGSINLLLFAFPAALAYGTWVATRRGVTDRGVAVLTSYVLLTALWHILSVNLVEFGENDRMRWEIDPLVLVLLVGSLAAAFRRVGRRVASNRGAGRRTATQYGDSPDRRAKVMATLR